MAQALRIEAIEDHPTRPVAHGRRGRQSYARQLRLAEPLPAARPTERLAVRPTLHALPSRPDPWPVLDPALLIHATLGEVAGLEALPMAEAGTPDALLAPGDQVMIQRSAVLTQGGLHAVVVPGHNRPVLRRVFATGDRLRLQPENRAFPAEELRRSEVRILGPVVAVLRHHP
jgi:hypothetical protein